MMVEYIVSMFGFTLFLIFTISFILFFVLIKALKNKAGQYKGGLLKLFRAYSIIVLGVLVAFGGELIFTGIWRIPYSKFGTNQLIQIGAGLLLIVIAGISFYLLFIARKRAEKRLERRKKEYPDAPWMWVDKWSEKRIVYSSRGTVIFVWFVMLVVIGGFVFVPYLKREAIFSGREGRDLLGMIVIFSLFFLFFLFCVSMVVSWTRGQLKFGKSIFEMSTSPGIVGGEIAGTIYTHMGDIPREGFVLDLECQFVDLKPQGVGRTTSPTPLTLWKTKKKVRFEEASMGPEGVSIPVSVSIPADAQESDEWSPDKRIEWMLSAFASFKGRKYLSQFIVPIFRTRSKS